MKPVIVEIFANNVMLLILVLGQILITVEHRLQWGEQPTFVVSGPKPSFYQHLRSELQQRKGQEVVYITSVL